MTYAPKEIIAGASVPLVDVTQLREWVETEVLPHALPLFAAYRRGWDGDNWIGVFPGHEAEKEEFDEWVDRHQDLPLLQGESAGLWDARDWLVDIPEGLLADSTDSALDALADEIAAEARRENIVLVGDVVAHLTKIRDEMQEAAPAPDRYEISGYETLEKLATVYGTGAHVCVPKGWGGHRVKIIRID